MIKLADRFEKKENEAADKYVLVLDLAKFLNINCEKFSQRIRRSRIPWTMIRNPVTGHQAMAVSDEDAKKIIEAETAGPEIIKPEDLVMKPKK